MGTSADHTVPQSGSGQGIGRSDEWRLFDYPGATCGAFYLPIACLPRVSLAPTWRLKPICANLSRFYLPKRQGKCINLKAVSPQRKIRIF